MAKKWMEVAQIFRRPAGSGTARPGRYEFSDLSIRSPRDF